MKRAVAVAIIALGGIALADTSGDLPTSQDALTAMHRREVALEKASKAYNAACILADKQEITDLTYTLEGFTKAGNLDEANRIAAVKKATEADLAAREGNSSDGPPPTVGSSVMDNTSWRFRGGNVPVRYETGGVVMFSNWTKPGKWKMVDANTVDQVQADGRHVRITLSSDRQLAFWQFLDSSEVEWATRVDHPKQAQ